MAKISNQLEELKKMLLHNEQEHRQMISLCLSALQQYGMISETITGDQHTYRVIPKAKDHEAQPAS